jgi:hypothetical protein
MRSLKPKEEQRTTAGRLKLDYSRNGRTREILLFHPRVDVWNEHFKWTGAQLVGRTAIGSVRIHVAAVNENVSTPTHASSSPQW